MSTKSNEIFNPHTNNNNNHIAFSEYIHIIWYPCLLYCEWVSLYYNTMCEHTCTYYEINLCNFNEKEIVVCMRIECNTIITTAYKCETPSFLLSRIYLFFVVESRRRLSHQNNNNISQ